MDMHIGSRVTNAAGLSIAIIVTALACDITQRIILDRLVIRPAPIASGAGGGEAVEAVMDKSNDLPFRVGLAG
ncbi:MAG TPA: hypothetical protein ENK06_14770 [Gammaproteobacteria bacterium]|nr:hypothetical protein [Gammaproteobacteria bacterium]